MKIAYGAPTHSLQRWFWLLLLLNILFIICSRIYLQPLTSGEIVRFEVAKETSIVESLVNEWKQTGKYHKALHGIYLDYLFIILYALGLSVACAFLSRLTGHEILIRSGKGASWLLAGAAICDVIENVAMTRTLHGTIASWNVMLTYDMAAAKFSVIILCLLFILVCLIFWLGNKIFSKDKTSMFF